MTLNMLGIVVSTLEIIEIKKMQFNTINDVQNFLRNDFENSGIYNIPEDSINSECDIYAVTLADSTGKLPNFICTLYIAKYNNQCNGVGLTCETEFILNDPVDGHILDKETSLILFLQCIEGADILYERIFAKLKANYAVWG